MDHSAGVHACRSLTVVRMAKTPSFGFVGTRRSSVCSIIEASPEYRIFAMYPASAASRNQTCDGAATVRSDRRETRNPQTGRAATRGHRAGRVRAVSSRYSICASRASEIALAIRWTRRAYSGLTCSRTAALAVTRAARILIVNDSERLLETLNFARNFRQSGTGRLAARVVVNGLVAKQVGHVVVTGVLAGIGQWPKAGAFGVECGPYGAAVRRASPPDRQRQHRLRRVLGYGMFRPVRPFSW